MKYGLAILFVFSISGIKAQGSFSFRNISINEGLSQSSVIDIAEDASGFLWLATQDGLNRYDGKNFLQFQKNFDGITTATYSRLGKLITTKQNDFWIITKGGNIERFNLYTQKFIPYKLFPDGKPIPPASCLTIDSKNNLWIGTEGKGLFQIHPDEKKYNHHQTSASAAFSLPSDNIIQVFEDSRKALWILTSKGVLQVINDSKPVYYNSPVLCSFITEDVQKKTIWLGSFGKGLYSKKEDDATFVQFTGFTLKNFPRNLVIEAIHTDKTGQVWIGTYGQGLYVIDNTHNLIHHFTANKKNRNSLAFNDVLSIKEDRNGGIWIGTDGGGVSYYSKQLNNFRLYSNNNFPDDVFVEPVRSITADKEGTVWVGTSNSGLTYINPQKDAYRTIRFASYKKEISNHERVVSLLSHEKDIWAGTQGNGLLLFDYKTKKQTQWFHPEGQAGFSIPDHTIWCLLPSSESAVWAGTNDAGLILIDKRRGILKQLIHNKDNQNTLAENTVRSLIKMNDSVLCIGLEKKGIQFYNTISDNFFSINNSEIESFWKKEVILKCFFYQAPLLWIGTFGNGLIAYNLQTFQSFFINEKHGLPNNTIYGILPDDKGALWLSTNKGICRFTPPSDLKKISTANFSTFTVNDGLQSNEFNTGAYYKDAHGKLYFGGISGLNFFDPADFNKSVSKIPVFITGLMVDNKPFATDTAIAFKKSITFSPDRNSFAFNFTGIDFISSGRAQYAYKLQGYDKEWVDAGNRGYAAYTNLPSGDYVFTVRVNDFSTSAESTTSIAIHIEPPLWKRWWFVTAVAFFILLLFYVFYRYRVNQLLRLQMVRNSIASDLHDDIGSSLTNISILSTLSERHLAEPGEAGKFLHRISDEVNTSSQALDDIIWSVNTKNDTLEETLARMRRYAAELFDAANITYHLHFEENPGGRKIDMEKRRDLFLIYKESLNNIYKHAKASEVWIETKLETKWMHLIIRDNGVGFDTRKTTHRNGLKNIENRIKKWEGNVSVKSAEDEGTVIHIKYPI